jgi:hypothetical protein
LVLARLGGITLERIAFQVHTIQSLLLRSLIVAHLDIIQAESIAASREIHS